MRLIPLILLFLIILSVSTTALYPICEDKVIIGENCTMLTPSITCTTPEYRILNTSGGLVQDNTSLEQINSSLYYFNFSQPEGDYIVHLCDDSTREIKVGGQRDFMTLAVIVAIPLIMGFFLLIGAATLSEKHSALKIALFLMSLVTVFASFHLGMVNVVKFFNFPELQNAIGSQVYWMGLVFGVIVTYFIIYLFIQATHKSAMKKDERLEY